VGNPIKKLAGQTAIYGSSSILGRFLNYLLTPYWINEGGGGFSTDQFGVITEMYAYVAFLVVFLTYGMETTYFRYASKDEYESKNVYSTILPTVIFSSVGFIIISLLFSQGIANWLLYPDHSEYVVWFAIIVGFDAVSSIPLAYLRKENRAKKFAVVNLGNVVVNIGLNLFFIGYCKTNFEAGNSNWLIDLVYNPEIGVGYVFIANLIASVFKLIVVLPEVYLVRSGAFVKSYLKPFFKYAIPLLFVGLAGIVNETLDRVLLKRILVNDVGLDEAMSQLGIYGANYKLSIVITLFIQAYRYAAEPFFFAKEKEKNSKEMYSKIMNYFVVVVSFLFLLVTGYIDLFKYFIPNDDFWAGLKVVPILLLANVLLGVYYNLSIWYKLSHKTGYGALVSIMGAIVTIGLNLALIPSMGYYGAAWATFFCYLFMVVVSYVLGQKYYPIPYNLKRILSYALLAVMFFLISEFFLIHMSFSIKLMLNTVILLVYIGIAYIFERPKKTIE
tara:strand:+ start:13494 stop:14996 length:1503 start_codon:yes stop_codon:yes gene_type:complete